jgi:hypothetical protein
VLGVEEHLVPNGEEHAGVPPVRVELSLAPFLPILQQHPHLASHLRQQAGSRVAVTRRRRRVRWCCDSAAISSGRRGCWPRSA